MDVLLHVGLSNAVVATVLALVAGVAGVLWRRRPALAHGLWLLVLLKLLTPPLVRVPIPVAVDAEATATVPVGPRAQEPLGGIASAPPDAEPEDCRADDARSAAGDPDQETEGERVANSASRADERVSEWPPVAAARALPEWRPTLLWAWLAGTAGWFLLAGVRLLRFSRLLRHAAPAPPEVQDEADRIAARLGMKWCPEVCLLPGRLAPMVWAGVGAPRLFLPADLLRQIDSESSSTLMAHELAHLRRGDHRVRLVEFFALGLFWWHPVVWLARRAIREAEEQCCDAWVVSALPGAGKTYATAILKTLDFLSAAPAAPPLACGIGQVSDLKRRLTMIMRGATPRTLCWREGFAVLVLACVLPLLPTLARAEPEESDDSQKAKSGRTEEKRIIRINIEENAALEKAKAELKRLEVELQKKAAEVREAGQRLKEAAEKLNREQGEQARQAAQEMAREIRDKVREGIRVHIEGMEGQRGRFLGRIEVSDADGKELKKGRTVLEGPVEIEVTADGKTIVRQLKSGHRASGSVTIPSPAAPAAPAAPTPEPAPAGRTSPRPGRVDVNTRVDVEMKRAAETAARAAAQARMRAEGKGEGKGEAKSDNRRIDDLERKLDAVLRQLESLKKEKVDAQRKEKNESRQKDKDKKSSKPKKTDEEEDND